MQTYNSWLLPDGIEDILPPHAASIDALCREIIDLYISWGYQLVIPPLIEYVESLRVGADEAMDSQMFKLIDQCNGRLMGVRVDMTAQAARIDAYGLQRDVPTRLCYLGPVLRTLPTIGSSRSPLQVGTELFGHQGVESDSEILCLMVETLRRVGIENIHIDLGHVGVYNRLIDLAAIEHDVEIRLFQALQQKSSSELQSIVSDGLLAKEQEQRFKDLMDAYGNVNELSACSTLFVGLDDAIDQCFVDLHKMVDLIKVRASNLSLSFDLSELHNYRYHTGIVFTAYVVGSGQGVAFGGRYCSVGGALGGSRPATGFSTDIKNLLNLGDFKQQVKMGIYAPYSEQLSQLETINDLRKQGEIVICELAGQDETAEDMGCDRQLVFEEGRWTVVSR